MTDLKFLEALQEQLRTINDAMEALWDEVQTKWPVVCEQAGHPDCLPTCIHGTPHLRDSVATVQEFPHLPEDTVRDCSQGPCCTRGVIVQCLKCKTGVSQPSGQ